MKISRTVSFLWILLIYALALAAAAFLYAVVKPAGSLAATFLADAAATLVVWLFGVVLRNSSVYDPYWSVAPVAIAVFWVSAAGPLSLAGALFAFAVLVWGARLTMNWARRWKGLAHEDWRYVQYKRNMPRLWFVINLLGINLMPTVLVFLGMIPVYFGVTAKTPVGLLPIAGLAVCALAVLLEHAADTEMDAYRRQASPDSSYIDRGVWRWCRHPNYLGEVLFWWGLWLMQAGLTGTLWTAIGPVLITLLFLFVSIPMMEKHMLEARPAYAGYIRAVPMLLPFITKGAAASKQEQAQR